MSVVMIGLPASGKTTVGTALAARLGVPFTDTDALVEEKTGKLVREIFAEEGEDRFRELEEQAAAEALVGPGVVSLGGGAVMNPAIRRLLAGHEVVWLDVSVVTLTRRVGMNRLRPLLLGDVRARLAELAGERLAVYEQAATIRVDAEQPVAAVVAQIMDGLAAAPTTIQVRGERAYEVTIGHGVLGRVADTLSGAAQVAIIHPPVLSAATRRVAELVPGPLPMGVPSGEGAKRVEVLNRCWRTLAQAGLTRSDAVIGLGGGTTTDLAGFVAATYLRGVAYVSVPTTVLAMADAAIGGKTGIDLPEGKNLAGAFYDPQAVVCDLDLLQGLPADEVRSGLAEIVKAGFIADPAILDVVDADPASAGDVGSAAFADILTRAIRIKSEVVSADFREQDSPDRVGRAALNYGHTLAHAIEKQEGFTWSHGYAVSVGMVFAAEVAHRLGLIGVPGVAWHRRLLELLGLPVTYHGVRWEDLRATMGLDKKARGSHLRMVLLEGLGRTTIVTDPDEDVLRDAFTAIGGTL